MNDKVIKFKTNRVLIVVNEQQLKFLNLLQILRGFITNVKSRDVITSGDGDHLALSTR